MRASSRAFLSFVRWSSVIDAVGLSYLSRAVVRMHTGHQQSQLTMKQTKQFMKIFPNKMRCQHREPDDERLRCMIWGVVVREVLQELSQIAASYGCPNENDIFCPRRPWSVNMRKVSTMMLRVLPKKFRRSSVIIGNSREISHLVMEVVMCQQMGRASQVSSIGYLAALGEGGWGGEGRYLGCFVVRPFVRR